MSFWLGPVFPEIVTVHPETIKVFFLSFFKKKKKNRQKILNININIF